MHPVRGKAHSYRVQTTGTGRGLSESRDTRKGILYLDAEWLRAVSKWRAGIESPQSSPPQHTAGDDERLPWV